MGALKPIIGEEYFLKKNHYPLISSRKENTKAIVIAIHDKQVYGNFPEDELLNTFHCMEHEFGKIFRKNPKE
jgi:hypothetical protein